ncbi:hypothetical protein ACLB2K_043584 [Fragaria x ananassa]
MNLNTFIWSLWSTAALSFFITIDSRSFFDSHELVPLLRSRIEILRFNLYKPLDEFGGGLVVLRVESLLDVVDAVGALNDGVEAEERGVDARLCEVELTDLGADVVGEVAGGGDVGEDVIGIGLDDLEDLGGLLEAGEVLVEIGALGEEAVEVEIQGALEKLEKKKALYFEKMQNKIAEVHKEAEEKRMMVQAAKKEECQKVEEMAEKYRATGHAPKNKISCFLF